MKRNFFKAMLLATCLICLLVSCKTAETPAEEQKTSKSNLEALMALDLGTRKMGDNSIRTVDWFRTRAQEKAAAAPAEENQGKIIFLGASNTDYWTNVSEDFPEYNILNFAIAGAAISELYSFSDIIVYPYNPKVMVLFGSTNDFMAAGEGVSDEELIELGYNARLTMFEDYSERFPDCVFVVLKTGNGPSRTELAPVCEEITRRLVEYCNTHDRFYYVDDYSFAHNEDGSFKMDLYIEDGLHYTKEARSEWAEYIRPVLAEAVDSLSDKGNVLK